MGKTSPHLQLRVPHPDRPTLSFCEATPQGVTRWVADLPKANLGETARQLYQLMVELNQLITPATNRLQMLELLRPEVHFVCQHLERHFLNQAIVLDERPRKVANLCQALQNHLAIGYKLVVSAETASFNPQRPNALSLALQRALHSLFGPLVRACQLYCPVPEGLWLEMHQLYQIAIQHDIAKLPLSDPLGRYSSTHSVEQTYVSALLMGCARTNQMRQNTIASLAEILEAWSPLVRLQPADSPSSLFAIATQIDGPPRYKTLFHDQDKGSLLGMDPSLLLEALNEYLGLTAEQREQARLPMTERLSVEHLQHLASAWGDIAERSFRRVEAQGSMRLCIGMTAVHYYMAGERTFEQVVTLPVKEESQHFSPPRTSVDVWSGAFDAERVSTLRNSAHENIQYQTPNAAGSFASAAKEEKYPTYNLLIVNHSPGGYCLSWPREVPAQLQAGELLGIQDSARQGWSLAVVRWIRQVRGGGTQMGIELIAPMAQPCGLQLLRKTEQHSQFLRALLLPEIKAISRAATLITPRLPFQEGSKVRINLQGSESRAILGKRQAGSSNFSQFEYRSIDSNEVRSDVPPPSNSSTKGLGEEDFDSLWKSL